MGLFGILVNNEFYHPWWNESYSYRYHIDSSATSIGAYSINDTYGVDGTVIWARILNSSYIYSTESGPAGTITIANQTNEKYWENETSRTGNSPTSVWDSNTEAVYHFGEGSGSTVYDSTTQNHTVLVTGQTAPDFVDGIFGDGYDFGGRTPDEAFDTGINAAGLGSAVTICAWGNHTTAGDTAFIAGSRAGGNYLGLGHYLTLENLFECFAYDGSNHAAKTAFQEPADTWFHACCVYNGTGIFLYYNGSYVDDDTVYTSGGIGGNLFVGDKGDVSGGDSRAWKGQLDEVRIYNKSLTPAEIQEHYWNGINSLTTLGAEETQTADETEGRNAIVEGIQNSAIGPSPTIYEDQQIYLRFLNNTQSLGTFDKVAISGNQRWAFNYVTTDDINGNESFTNMSSLEPVVYVWENESIIYSQIVNQVETFINQTKV